MKSSDSIVDEVRAAREAIAKASVGCDRAIADSSQSRIEMKSRT